MSMRTNAVWLVEIVFLFSVGVQLAGLGENWEIAAT